MAKSLQCLTGYISAPISNVDTEITVRGLKDIYGENIRMVGDILYATLEPKSATDQEITSFTNVIEIDDDTVRLTGCTRGLKAQPDEITGLLDADPALASPHSANVEIILSNNPQFYDGLTFKDEDETITGQWDFEDSPTAPNPDNDEDVATKGYVDSVAILGSPDASTTIKGIARLSADPSTTLGTFTVTVASPAVFSLASHGLIEGDTVRFTTDGALPTGLLTSTNYYVIAAGLTSGQFQVSLSYGGAAVNTSGSQSGTHTLYRVTPIAVSPNDAFRVLTQNEKNAIAGSSGNPVSSSNPLLDDDDTTGTGAVLRASAIESLSLDTLTLGGTVTALDIVTLLPDGEAYKLDGFINSGTEFVNTANNVQSVRIIYIDDANTTVVVAWTQSTADTVNLRAGTISNGVITFGTAVVVESTITAAADLALVKIDNNAGAVMYRDSAQYDLCAFTVSGTAITAGTPATCNALSTSNTIAYFNACKIDTNKVLCVYGCGAATADANAVVANITGTSISFGAELVDFTANAIKEIRCCQNATNEAIITTINAGDDINATVATISGTTITSNFASSATLTATAVRHSIYRIYDDLAIVCYDDTDIKAAYITVSTVTPTWRTVQTILATSTFSSQFSRPLFFLNDDIIGIGGVSGATSRVAYCKRNDAAYELQFLESIDYALITGTGITFAASNFLTDLERGSRFFALDSSLTSRKVYMGNYDKRYIIGIAQESGVAAESKKVARNGQTSTGHSSLTPGEKYYANYNGAYTKWTKALSTTYLGQIGMLGKAKSATEILVNIPYEDL